MLSNRRTILHVDDEPAITKLVGRHLERAGYEVDAIHNPLEALEAVEREQYRVVILDVDMPLKSGMHLLSEIKNLDCGVQVIMLSGVVSPSIILEALNCGAEAYLFKPFDDPQPLIEVVTASFKKIDCWWNTFRDLAQRKRSSQSAGPAIETVALT